jgi:hypothetical protein
METKQVFGIALNGNLGDAMDDLDNRLHELDAPTVYSGTTPVYLFAHEDMLFISNMPIAKETGLAAMYVRQVDPQLNHGNNA